MANNSVAVVVLNWNGSVDTVQCIESLLAQTTDSFDIIVVDNGSNTGDINRLRQYINTVNTPIKITLLFNKKNLGFTGGVNTGIRWADAHNFKYVALLNNDATAKTDWLSKLLTSAKQSSLNGIVTSLMLDEKGEEIDSTGEIYTVWGLPYPRDRGKLSDDASPSGYVCGASGGASLYRLSMLRQVGFFDDRFFAYYEDVDLSLRALLHGWKIFYERSAIVYHHRGETSRKINGFTTKQAFRNLPLLLKNLPTRLLMKIAPRFYCAYTLMYLKALFTGRFKPATRGIIESIPLRYSTRKNRRALLSSQKISTKSFEQYIERNLPPNQKGLRKLRSIISLGKY